MAATALCYLAAWGPFCVLCLWEMVVMPQVKNLQFCNLVLLKKYSVPRRSRVNIAWWPPYLPRHPQLSILSSTSSCPRVFVRTHGLSSTGCLIVFKVFFKNCFPQKAEVRVKRKENFEEEFWAEETNYGDVGADDNCTGGHQPNVLVYEESWDISKEDFCFHRDRQPTENQQGKFGWPPK